MSMMALLAGAMIATAARAQTPDVRPDIRIEQQQQEVGPPSAQVAAPQISDRSGAPRVEPTASQIGSPAQVDAPVAQVSAGGRSAREPDSISRPAEGRTGAVARVEGQDRCDPELGSDRPALCDRVIETRSAEFARPAPLTLSPEQRLLVDQRVREATGGARLADPRRADGLTLNPDSFEEQAIAAVALARNAPEERRPDAQSALPKLPDASAALIDALLQNAGAPPQSPPQ